MLPTDAQAPPQHQPAVRNKLLQWFADNGRDLPWRRTRDPYHILVSEIMLQQTQVDRVVPKYRAFLERFPTLAALAEAPAAEVIKAWAGLGYNRRAVNLQRAARTVLAEYGGLFPRDVALLRGLPGIGPYTAGAVACFAFEQDVGFIDTNIRRVIQRLFVGPEEAGVAPEARLLQLAQQAVPAGQGWAWNQAIMELGALICTAAVPACWRCPLQSECRAYAMRRQADEQVFDGAGPATPQRRARAAERRAQYGRPAEQPYAGSNRFYRGRVVDALRQLAPGQSIGLAELGRAVKQPFGDDDLPWLRAIASGLANDGLIVFDGESAQLPG